MSEKFNKRDIAQKALNKEVDRLISEIGTTPEAVIPILHAIQNKYNYLPPSALKRVCAKTEITPAAITGVSSFFTQFRHTPVGDHIIQVCTGTACHVKGAELVYEAFRRELHIPEENDTDPEGQFTIQRVSCLGCCTLAPVVQIDGMTYGHVTVTSVMNILQDFLVYNQEKDDEGILHRGYSDEIGEVRIGLGSCCVASGSAKVRKALEESLRETGIHTRVKRVGCVGMCHRVPLLEVLVPEKEPVLYDNVQPGEVKRIIQRHFKAKSLSKRINNSLLHFFESILDDDSKTYSQRALTVRDPQVTVFLDRQQHIVTENAGTIDPLDMEEYRSRNGFNALRTVLSEWSVPQLIEQIKASGLRGRGGAGYPTGYKWQLAQQKQDEPKYIICNGDEGDPGAFMDRMILESYPFRVIEGMIIAAYAVGAHDGYFYIRAEYPLAVQRIKTAIEQCEKTGFLGDDILGSGFSLRLQVYEGAGAFVCGEETALIASIEGKRGMPNYRPPYPVEKGLWGHSTLVNNCETYATIPWIINYGPEEFAQFGTKKSKGSKVFSLAGKVVRGGLIEVPMGISIREVVEEIGGGIEGGKHFKAVQIGGPSGGCVPAELAHTKVDYEDLLNVGAMMGSGGLLVLDENDCMVDMARYFLNFTFSQSCGKCTFCRIGIRHMLDILENITTGKAHRSDLDKLEKLSIKTKQGSLCGLGKTAPNPVLSTLTYFREEYEAHINGICPAKRCKQLITYSINNDCIGCTICAQKCPAEAIPIIPYQKHEIVQEKCTKCDTCFQVCPENAVEVN